MADENADQVRASLVAAAEGDVAPIGSEDAIAIEFVKRHGDGLKYVSEIKTWFKWNGKVWKKDTTLETFDLARRVVREAALNRKGGAKIANAKTRAAVVSLSSADRKIASTIDVWDADPWLLNTPDGVFDLKTGKRRDAKPEDYMTKTTAVAPNRMKTPFWDAHLLHVLPGEGLVKYTQRVFGYCLTGITIEHLIAFFYGAGGNGKTVTTKTVTDIFGDYHRSIMTEALIASDHERHSTDIAGLVGARLVTATETNENRYWDEAKIKQLTGGDPISARFMRQNPFTFVPQFTLLVSGNNKPKLRSVDEAIRRRFKMVNFGVTITAEKDPKLLEKLKAEWPGILQSMIDGCLEWQRDGLGEPASVRVFTDEYLADEDSVARWIEERCERKPGEEAPFNPLYSDFRTWCENNGIRTILPSTTFALRLSRLGIDKAPGGTGHAKKRIGLVLRTYQPEKKSGAGIDTEPM